MDAKQTFAAEIERVGGPASVAKKLGLTRQAITGWLEKGEAPIRRCVDLAESTGADRRRLRPSDWWSYWPELRGPDASSAPGATPEGQTSQPVTEEQGAQREAA